MSRLRHFGLLPHHFSLAFALGVREWLNSNECRAHASIQAAWKAGFFTFPWGVEYNLPPHLQRNRFKWLKTRLWLPKKARIGKEGA